MPPKSLPVLAWRRRALAAGQGVAVRAEPASVPGCVPRRPDTSSALLREIPFLLELAHRLDRYLQPHEVDRAAGEEASLRRRLLRAQSLGQS